MIPASEGKLGNMKGVEPVFLLPVDSEHKATVFRPYRISGVHMVAFHVSWLSFFTSFLSTFAPAALVTVLRDNLNLTDISNGHAGVASVAGTIFSRIVLGSACDTIGPRFGHASLLLLTAPAVLGLALVEGSVGFIVSRCVISFSLATFVACQFWSSVMFNVNIVAVANATGAGWGSMGGGVTQILMPFLYTKLLHYFEGYVAWRVSLFVPALLHILVGTLILFASQDLPDGTYAELKAKGQLSTKGGSTASVGVRNYRTWLLAISYGFTFGVELVMNNTVTSYYVDNFGVALGMAGVLGSLYGAMNLFSRATGGLLSDAIAKPFGMRGRLWALFLLQILEGVLCIVLGLLSKSLVGTIATVVALGITVQAAEGATFGVVPFVSKRALGIVAGVVGAGGNAGATVIESVFFDGQRFEIPEAFIWTGYLVILTALVIPVIYFPMWGGILRGRREGSTEEDYYLAEFTPEEVAQGLARLSLKFATESRSQRGSYKSNRKMIRNISTFFDSHSSMSSPMLRSHILTDLMDCESDAGDKV